MADAADVKFTLVEQGVDAGKYRVTGLDNPDVVVGFAPGTSDTKKLAILERKSLAAWLKAEASAYPDYPIILDNVSAISFDGKPVGKPDDVKDIVGHVRTQVATQPTHDYETVGYISFQKTRSAPEVVETGRGIIIGHPTHLVFIAFDIAAKEATQPPETWFLFTETPRHGNPDSAYLGMLGGAMSEGGAPSVEASIRKDVSAALKPFGFAGDKAARLVNHYSSIGNSGNEEIVIDAVTLELDQGQFTQLKSAMQEIVDRQDVKDARGLMLMRADAAVRDILGAREDSGYAAPDGIPVMAMGAYRSEERKKYADLADYALGSMGKDRSAARLQVANRPAWVKYDLEMS